LCLDVTQNNTTTLCNKPADGGGTDAAGRSCYYRNFSIQSISHNLVPDFF
jgi:hypothetical protein